MKSTEFDKETTDRKANIYSFYRYLDIKLACLSLTDKETALRRVLSYYENETDRELIRLHASYVLLLCDGHCKEVMQVLNRISRAIDFTDELRESVFEIALGCYSFTATDETFGLIIGIFQSEHFQIRAIECLTECVKRKDYVLPWFCVFQEPFYEAVKRNISNERVQKCLFHMVEAERRYFRPVLEDLSRFLLKSVEFEDKNDCFTKMCLEIVVTLYEDNVEEIYELKIFYMVYELVRVTFLVISKLEDETLARVEHAEGILARAINAFFSERLLRILVELINLKFIDSNASKRFSGLVGIAVLSKKFHLIEDQSIIEDFWNRCVGHVDRDEDPRVLCTACRAILDIHKSSNKNFDCSLIFTSMKTLLLEGHSEAVQQCALQILRQLFEQCDEESFYNNSNEIEALLKLKLNELGANFQKNTLLLGELVTNIGILSTRSKNQREFYSKFSTPIYTLMYSIDGENNDIELRCKFFQALSLLIPKKTKQEHVNDVKKLLGFIIENDRMSENRNEYTLVSLVRIAKKTHREFDIYWPYLIDLFDEIFKSVKNKSSGIEAATLLNLLNYLIHERRESVRNYNKRLITLVFDIVQPTPLRISESTVAAVGVLIHLASEQDGVIKVFNFLQNLINLIESNYALNTRLLKFFKLFLMQLDSYILLLTLEKQQCEYIDTILENLLIEMCQLQNAETQDRVKHKELFNQQEQRVTQLECLIELITVLLQKCKYNTSFKSMIHRRLISCTESISRKHQSLANSISILLNAAFVK